jgi:hypothetical protein
MEYPLPELGLTDQFARSDKSSRPLEHTAFRKIPFASNSKFAKRMK